MTHLNGYQEKGWGYEIIWANNDKYCGKILSFNTAGSKTSLHFHKERDKTWFINAGQFKVRFIDTQTTEIKEAVLKAENEFFSEPDDLYIENSFELDGDIFSNYPDEDHSFLKPDIRELL